MTKKTDSSGLTQPGFLRRLWFALTYGLKNIRRGGRWTTLAVFSVAAGVAAVVALRGLGLSIGESLISTVRDDNKGDFQIEREADRGPDFALLRGSDDLEFFAPDEIASIESYAAERGIRLSEYTTGGAVQIAGQQGGMVLTTQFIDTYLINPQTYPAVGDVRVIAPEGAVLAQLFGDGNDIVISENMAQQQGLSVGDTVRVARTEETFTVTGIVGGETEAGISNPFAAFFGFAYFDLADVRNTIDPEIGINRIALAYPEPLTAENEARELEALLSETTLRQRNTEIDSAVEMLEDRQDIAVVLGDFIVVMGLGALLIGGVGIMNTMLVLVRRRTNEIAALKTFGLKGRQVALLFLVEATLLGLIGSVIGSVAGVLLGGLVNQYGEQFLQQSLAWRIYPQALLYGFTLGMLVTMVFGLVPILATLQIRPATILRPNEGGGGRLGWLQSLGLMLLITVILGLIVGQIVQPTFGLTSSLTAQDAYLWSVIGVAIALAILGILTLLLWVLVWLVGKLPAFGIVHLKLALRNMTTNRLRTATTLLALSAGMFALSSIAFVGEGTRELLNGLLSNSFGGNVLVLPVQPSFDERLTDLAARNYARALEDVPGVNAQTTIGNYNSELLRVNGEIVERVNEEDINPTDDTTFAPFAWSIVAEWDSNNAEAYAELFDVVEGRALTLDDRGQRVMIGPADTAAALGIEPGAILEYEFGSQTISFEVVGLYEGSGAFFGSNPVIAPESLQGVASPLFQFYAFDVEEEYTAQAVTELSSVTLPPTVAIDVRFIDSLISRFIQQFAAIPTAVGLLSLLAAAVIMANTVALSTLERRRQIGILKAIGLKSNRVLIVMLIESTIIGLLSAILGLGLSSLGLTIFTSFSGTTIPLPREAQGFAIALVIAAVAISWISTFLSANVAVRERVMNVLRYE